MWGWDGNDHQLGPYRGMLQSHRLPEVHATCDLIQDSDCDSSFFKDDSENECWEIENFSAVAADAADNPLSRAQLKALDREIPWRDIWNGSKETLTAFQEAVRTEASKWKKWCPIPVDIKRAYQIRQDRYRRRFILKTHCCYKNKNAGTEKELMAKCRIVALGCNHPKLAEQQHSAPTATKLGLMVRCQILASSQRYEPNGEAVVEPWQAVFADAETAFLQGKSGQTEPLFITVPDDPVFRSANDGYFAAAELWEVIGNIYGLVNAPWNWFEHVVSILLDGGFIQHPLEVCLFLWFDRSDTLRCAILIHVDDFAITWSKYFEIEYVQKSFTWGSWKQLVRGGPAGTYKAQQIRIELDGSVTITQEEFARGIESRPIPRERLAAEPELRPEERTEVKSVVGSVLHLAGHTRIDLAAPVSLVQKGDLTITELQEANDLAAFAQRTADIVLRIKPLNLLGCSLSDTETPAGQTQTVTRHRQDFSFCSPRTKPYSTNAMRHQSCTLVIARRE